MAGETTARGTLVLAPGTLWTSVIQRTKRALQCGALQPLSTQCEFIEQDGIDFNVRVLPNLARKDEAKQQQEKQTATSGKEFNPFLPYDEALFVADISDTHVCLLNKFSVIDHHLLIVTRSFEEQETLLTLQDFEAMWACLAEVEGLAFYNAGRTAGGSQRHKHLQLVPLPLVPRGPRIPTEPLLTSANFQNSVGTVPGFPFVHAIAQLNSRWAESPLTGAEATFACYHNLLSAVGLQAGSNNRQSGAYNLLVTRQWMLLVPRSQESFESISVNALGFAGTFLVRSEEQLQRLRDHSPMTVLSQVAVVTA